MQEEHRPLHHIMECGDQNNTPNIINEDTQNKIFYIASVEWREYCSVIKYKNTLKWRTWNKLPGINLSVEQVYCEQLLCENK